MPDDPKAEQRHTALLEAINRSRREIMTAIEALTAAVEKLEANESAAAAEFAKLLEELKAAQEKGTGIDAAEVEALATRAAAVADKLGTDTPTS